MSDIIDQEFLLFASKASRLLDEGESEKALHLCEAGVKRFPFYAQGHYVMGLCYQTLNQSENAKDEFERTLFFEPAHTGAMRHLAQLGTEAGLTEVANEWLLQTALYTPDDAALIDVLKEKGIYERFAGGAETETGISPEFIPEAEESPLAEAADLPMVDDIPPLELTDMPHEENSEEPLEELRLEDESADPLVEPDPADRFDPLAGQVDIENMETESQVSVDEKPRNMDLSSFAETDEDFSSFMDDYLEPKASPESDETGTQDEWLEVDDLIVDEQPDLADGKDNALTDETQLLLEELSSDDADIDFSIISDEPEELADPEPETVDFEEPVHTTAQEKSEESDTAWQEIEPIDVETFEPEIPAVKEEDDEDVTIDKLMKNPNLVTPTFGEILIAQRKFNEARHVFSQLAQREPDNPKFAKKISFLDKFLEASKA